MSNSDLQARYRARAKEEGGKMVSLRLSAAATEALSEIRAGLELSSDRAAIEHSLAKMAESLSRKKV